MKTPKRRLLSGLKPPEKPPSDNVSKPAADVPVRLVNSWGRDWRLARRPQQQRPCFRCGQPTLLENAIDGMFCSRDCAAQIEREVSTTDINHEVESYANVTLADIAESTITANPVTSRSFDLMSEIRNRIVAATDEAYRRIAGGSNYVEVTANEYRDLTTLVRFGRTSSVEQYTFLYARHPTRMDLGEQMIGYTEALPGQLRYMRRTDYMEYLREEAP